MTKFGYEILLKYRKCKRNMRNTTLKRSLFFKLKPVTILMFEFVTKRIILKSKNILQLQN